MINYIMKLVTITIYIFACCVGFSEDLNEASSKLIKSFGIEKNFKGFAYQSDAPENILNIRSLPGTFDDKDLVGVTLIMSDDGRLSEIKPLFAAFKESFEPSMWALDMFKRGDLTSDALWEVLRASIPKDANDHQVLSFLISTLELSEEYPALSEVPIKSNGSLLKAVENVVKRKWIEKPKTLEDVKLLLK